MKQKTTDATGPMAAGTADPFLADAGGTGGGVTPFSREGLEASVARASRRIAPVWPLQHFVAVNPFLGITEQRFEEAAATLRRVCGADTLMPRRYYRDLIEQGRILDDDLEQALKAAPKGADLPHTVAGLKSALAQDPAEAGAGVVTVADTLDRVRGGTRAGLVVEEVSKWCAAYWDEGQAAWRMPWRGSRPFPAWLAAARHDHTPEVMGVTGFRSTMDRLPEDPVDAIEMVVRTLGLPAAVVDDYLHRNLFTVSGWAAYARYVTWNKELYGEPDDTVVHVLAIRLAWDYAFFVLNTDTAFRTAWAQDVAAMAEADRRIDRDLSVDAVLQTAFDAATQRGFIAKLVERKPAAPASLPRKPLQAAFCIDVRSEVFRRALETVAPEAETIGFAGFFGFPLEFIPIGHERGGAQCPVLLTPKFVVRETVAGASAEERTEILGLRLLRRRAAKAWKSFKSSAVSSFVFVETIGLAFAAKLASDTAGMTRTVSHPLTDGLDRDVLQRVGPDLERQVVDGRATGFSDEERVDMAAAVLGAMSMTGDFGRLVMLAGHGSTTVNNPHASGLDCGACGGHTGEANARVAAAILNDARVRKGLAERGIMVSDETWFLGCLHDTTTDEITLYDREAVPASHQQDLKRLDSWLKQASALARAERAALLGVDPESGLTVDAQVIGRSRDWSQVRPEWGLAGNAAFIAAPRERTRGVDLGGRSFLHSYDWRQDQGFGVLELIMTAPMVVASWINLQYYGSTVDNKAYGCGNKVLHNVVGTLGVLEGNGGDLRVGLPWQSIHDGQRLIHEPLRLNVFIEAPIEPMDAILEKHANVRELVDNRWLYLFAIAEEGRRILRYDGVGRWVPAGGEPPAEPRPRLVTTRETEPA